ncbi:hypothetical protein Tco_0365358 [Tanacetum coccineum]
MPERMRVGEFLPPYYISQLEVSIIISGSFSFGDCRILYAWDLQVDDDEVSSYRQLFAIPYPAEHELKLLGFSKDKQPIPRKNYFGCEFFIWKEERVHLLISSPGASSTPSFSPGTSSTPIFSPGPSTPPTYSGGSSRNGDCSNCKLLLARIKLLEAQLEMYMHPEQHTLNSNALLHKVYNDMGKLGLE